MFSTGAIWSHISLVPSYVRLLSIKLPSCKICQRGRNALPPPHTHTRSSVGDGLRLMPYLYLA